jgi:acetyltransferase-like isoleucine patch superfamily enzyme
MKNYRKLTADEILRLKSQSCAADDWEQVWVDEHFTTGHVHHTRFSGEVKLGVFDAEFVLPGGIKKHAGLRHVTLHNVTLGDNCCIEHIQSYMANYEVGDHTFIGNVGIILTDGPTKFGNGVEATVLNETGGREVLISDKLSAQQAYIMALYRHRPELIRRMKEITDYYSNKHASATGRIGSHVTITNTGSVKNVKVGDHCRIEGACRLENGSINSNEVAPVHVGYGVICEDFILSSGSHVDDGTVLSRCFVGQACRLGHNYSASDSLFFSNCQGENGEACAIFAGPFTVTHHKSTLLIAGMFSFMNAGSGSNQSNHIYKLGPIHQGTMERGAKTASDSYILWPARVGAFSLVMGRHVNHADTSNLPFSYLIEQGNTTYLMPGVNLRSVGTIRDAQKWPKRDRRTDPNRLDCINYNLLSPYTIQKMFNGCAILKELRRVSGETSEIYSYQSAKIKSSSLNKGLKLYETAIHKFLGNSIIKRLEGITFRSDEEIRQRLKPDTDTGTGEWVDISGLIAPKSEVEKLLCGIESGEINRLHGINERFEIMHTNYYTYEWTWAYHKIREFYGIDPEAVTADDIMNIVNRWKDAVIGLDRLIYEDARKEFSLSSMTGFGADGSRNEMKQDFGQVRGDFESNPFVTAVLKHIEVKTALGDELIQRLKRIKTQE